MNYPQYDPQSALTPLAEADFVQLERTLSGLVDADAMSLDGVDGYLTALLVGPPSLLTRHATSQWLPLVWGGDLDDEQTAPFGSKRQRKDTVVLVLRHLRHLQHLLSEDLAAWEPIFSIAETETQEWVDATDWCAGFLQAVDLDPDAWGEVWESPPWARSWLPCFAWAVGSVTRRMTWRLKTTWSS